MGNTQNSPEQSSVSTHDDTLCPDCQHWSNCTRPCPVLLARLPHQRAGTGREFTNERGFERHSSGRRRPVPGYGFSKLLMVDWIFTPKELEVIKMLNSGWQPSAIAGELGISRARVSQLKTAAIRKYEAHEIKERAAVYRLAREENQGGLL